MEAIEIEISIGKDGSIKLPEQYNKIYGQRARLVILLPDLPRAVDRQINPMNYSNTVDWPVDAMAYQRKVREEWE